MKLNRNTVLRALYTSLYLASMDVSALTLGKLRGAVLLGKELNVAVAVQYAADEDIASTCFDADVRFGDILVEGGRLTVKAIAGPQPQTQIVNISTSSRVEDAVVTVNLRTSCGPKASRRYVLLSDVLSESTSSSAVTLATKDVSSTRVELPSVSGKPTADASAVPATKAVVASTSSSRKTVAGNAVTKPLSAAAGAERSAVAKAANQANALVLEDLQRRVDGIEKWQAQSTAAEDLLKSQERNQVLEAGINGLKAVSIKNQQSLQQVVTALESIESENYGRSLVYALGVLLAVCGVAVGYVFKRSRVDGADNAPWWLGGDGRTEVKPAVKAGLAEPVAPAAVVPSVPRQKVVQSPVHVDATVPTSIPHTEHASVAPVVDVDFDIDFSGGPAADSGVPTIPVPVWPRKEGGAHEVAVATANAVQSRVINTQEMLDVRQQAEFFMALGQHDDAVCLLESGIHDSAEANPLVYLDLLKIFHTLSRREDFERYRVEFNQCFTGRVPAYADFLSEGNGLDAYEEICQQIVVLWPTEYTVDFIEQCLVRTPEDDPEQGIDLEAFKDLLLLYGILKRLSQPVDSSMVPFSTSRISNSQIDAIQQGQSSERHVDIEGAAVPLPTIAGSVEEPAVDLDLDLGGDDVAPEEVPGAGNLIDFDMSGFVKPESGKPGPK